MKTLTIKETRQLITKYEDWLALNPIFENSPLTLLTLLDSHKLLNTTEIRRLINNDTENVQDNK